MHPWTADEQAHHQIVHGSSLKFFSHRHGTLWLPHVQKGCRYARCTSRVIHLSTEFTETCKRKRMLSAILFIDLMRAFVKILRGRVRSVEHLQNEASESDVMKRHIAQQNLPSSVAEQLLKFLQEHASVLLKCVRNQFRRLLADLHQDVWFRVEQLACVLVTTLSSRLGCRFGPLNFKLSYPVATREVQEAIAPVGITLHLLTPHVAIPCSHDVTVWRFRIRPL